MTDTTSKEKPCGDGHRDEKNPVAEVVAKTVGLVVEASSLLAGDPMASLEGDIAEAEVENALDRSDTDCDE